MASTWGQGQWNLGTWGNSVSGAAITGIGLTGSTGTFSFFLGLGNTVTITGIQSLASINLGQGWEENHGEKVYGEILLEILFLVVELFC